MTTIKNFTSQINITGTMVLRSENKKEEVRQYVQKKVAAKFNVDTFYVSVDLYKEDLDALEIYPLNFNEWSAHYSIIYSTNELQ